MVDDTEVDADQLETDDKHVSYKLINSCSEHQNQLRNLVWGWTELKPDVCMITEDGQRVFTQRIVLSLHSKFLCSLLRDQGHQLEDNNLLLLSVPCPAKPVRLLLRLITLGVTVSFSRAELRETEKVAKILGIQINRSIIKKMKIARVDILSYSKQPVKIKIANIKPNIIDVKNPSVDDMDILDEEIKVVDPAVRTDPDPMEEFPNTTKFRSKIFSEKIKKLKDSGLVIERSEKQVICLTEDSADGQFQVPKVEPNDEFAPGCLLSEDISSSQSDSGSVTLAERERKQTKRKLYAEDPEPKELPERKNLRLSVSDSETFSSTQGLINGGTQECHLAHSPSRRTSQEYCQSSPRTPKTSVQRELYNSCDYCAQKRAEENINTIKQKKYFQILKNKRADSEKCRGKKFPCTRCDYVAATPSNLKTHQMANHDGENFFDNYINEYWEKNKFLIL